MFTQSKDPDDFSCLFLTYITASTADFDKNHILVQKEQIHNAK